MTDDHKKKKQLIDELSELRSQNAALKKSMTGSISAELAVEEALRYAESILGTVREPLLVLDADLKIISANHNFYRTFKVTPGETIGSFIYDLGNRQWDISKLRELLEEVLPEKEAFDDFEVDHNFQDIGHKSMLLNAREIYRKDIGSKMILLAIEDITERKEMEDLLAESEERYRRLFETASDGIVLLEKSEGKITHTNPATAKMLGYTTKDSIGNKLQDIGVSLDLDDFQTTMEDLNKSGIINYRNVEVETKSGQHIDTEIYLVDRAKLVQCNIRDITERKRTEEALRESEELFRSSLEYAPDGVYMSDVKGAFLYGNRKCEEILGYRREELLGKNFLELNILSKKGLDEAVPLLQANIEGKPTGPDEFELINKDGRLIPVEISTSVVKRTGEGMVLAFVRDITDRKQAEEKLRESEEKFRWLLDNMADVITVMDMDLRFTYVSPSIMRMRGYTAEEAVAQTLEQVMTPESLQISAKVFAEEMALEASGTADPDRIRIVEVEEYRKDGSIVLMENHLSFLRDEAKKPVGIISVSHDITQRKKAEEELTKAKTLLDKTFASMEEAILVVDSNTRRVIACNQATEVIFGFGEKDLIGCSTDVLHVDKVSYDFFGQELFPALDAKGVFRTEFQMRRKDGSVFPTENTVTEILHDSGHRTILVSVVRDITERKEAEEELRESEERFRRIFDEGPFGMGLENPDHKIIAVNKVLCDLLGYTEQELIDQSTTDIVHEEDREKNSESLEQLFADGTPILRMEKRYIRKDGTILWANTTISAIHGKEGNVLYGLAIIEDLTETRKAAEKIHRLAFYDGLTGLPNRTFHKELMKKAIAHARRRKEIFALLYIGLDNFKRINDTLGYGIGDLLLKAVADRLAKALRKSDYVARSSEHEIETVISRAGGDEFIVLAHDTKQSHNAAKMSRRLLKELSVPYDLSGQEVFMTVSIGIALYPDDGTDADDLLKNAEKSMRHTKNEGKNNFHFYSSSMHDSVMELLTLENDLHRALERNELMLYYQPKVDAVTRMVTGMEALIRWSHPDKGLIPPMQFIPVAETSGLILPIGEFVVRTVCGQIKTWQEAGYKHVSIALNVSGQQFEKQNLIEIIKAAVQDAMIHPQCLAVEITESTLMRNPEKAIQILTELKEMGLSIAIDDFGTGYSSLSYLKRLPLDFLKIDQSFVKGLASDPKDQAIIRTIIAMAHSLNLKTIAEGVETKEQLSFLQEHGCDEIQGYLFSRPLPAEEIQGILAKGFL